MTPPVGIGAASAGGLAAVEARMSAIASRIDQLVDRGTGSRTSDASFALETAPAGSPRAAGSDASGAAVRSPSGRDGAATSSGTVPLAGLPPSATRWMPDIEAAAADAGLDPALFASLVRHESGFQQDSTSHAGAIGLAQLMPGTAEALGVDPHDPRQNLAGGARYLKEQLDRFGSVDLALAAYNAGPNRVLQAGGVPRIPETLAYVDRVMNTWEQLR